jgi:hypothetical protein
MRRVLSLGDMEDHTQCRPLAAGDRRDTVPYPGVVAAILTGDDFSSRRIASGAGCGSRVVASAVAIATVCNCSLGATSSAGSVERPQTSQQSGGVV